MNSTKIARFMNQLDEINGFLDQSSVFWRLQEDGGNATNIQAYEDPNIIVNLSFWESPEQLQHFV